MAFVSDVEDESSTFFRNVATNQAHFTAKIKTQQNIMSWKTTAVKIVT